MCIRDSLLLGKRIEQTDKLPESNQKQKVQRQAPAKSLQNAVIHMNVGRKNKVSMIAVSYTHLDVYKRQAVDGPCGNGQHDVFRSRRGRVYIVFIIQHVAPVSYTHLDVYKRQHKVSVDALRLHRRQMFKCLPKLFLLQFPHP